MSRTTMIIGILITIVITRITTVIITTVIIMATISEKLRILSAGLGSSIEDRAWPKCQGLKILLTLTG